MWNETLPGWLYSVSAVDVLHVGFFGADIVAPDVDRLESGYDHRQPRSSEDSEEPGALEDEQIHRIRAPFKDTFAHM